MAGKTPSVPGAVVRPNHCVTCAKPLFVGALQGTPISVGKKIEMYVCVYEASRGFAKLSLNRSFVKPHLYRAFARAPLYSGFVKHPCTCGEKTEMCICVYAATRGFTNPPLYSFVKPLLYRGILKLLGALHTYKYTHMHISIFFATDTYLPFRYPGQQLERPIFLGCFAKPFAWIFLCIRCSYT